MKERYSIIKNRGVLLLLLLFSAMLNAQTNIEWLSGFGGPHSQSSEQIAVDGEGNTYVYGRFNSSMMINTTTLNAQDGDGYLIRYNASKSVNWIKQVKNISVKGLLCSGNRLLMYGQVNDSARLGDKIYHPEGTGDGMVISLTLYGEILKEFFIKGPDAEFVNGLATDNTQSIYIAATIFPGSSVTDFTFQVSNSAMTVIKLNNSWNVVWHQTMSQNTEYVKAKSVSCNAAGTKITILGMAGSGSTHGAADSVLFSNSHLTYKFPETYGYFIASLNVNGEAQNVSGFYGMNHYFVESIATDMDDNVYLAGSSYYSGYHITKYNPELVVLWQKNILFHPESWFYAMKVNQNGDIFTLGSFYENIDFGEYAVSNNLQGSLFLAKHNNNGELKWTITGSGNKSTATSLASGSTEDIYLTGYFNGTLMLQSKLAGSTGETDFFIAKINDDLINKLKEQGEIISAPQVYPNPTQGVFRVTNQAVLFDINVYSADGKKVYQSFNTREGNITHLPKGSYFVELINSNDRHITKVVLK